MKFLISIFMIVALSAYGNSNNPADITTKRHNKNISTKKVDMTPIIMYLLSDTSSSNDQNESMTEDKCKKSGNVWEDEKCITKKECEADGRIWHEATPTDPSDPYAHCTIDQGTIPTIKTQQPYDITQSYRDFFKITPDNEGQMSVPQEDKDFVKDLVSTASERILDAFPKTFVHLRGKGLTLGLAFNELSNDIYASVLNQDQRIVRTEYEGFKQYKVVSGAHDMEISINRYNTGTATEKTTQDMISTITHETMHALMYEALTSGMTGVKADLNEGNVKFPNWFIEGMATIAGGGTKFVQTMILGSTAKTHIDWKGDEIIDSFGIDITTNSTPITKEQVAKAINKRDIKRGRKFWRKMDGSDVLNVYGLGYVYLAYLGQLITDGDAWDNNTPTSKKIREGLDNLMAMIAMGYSIDDAIRKLTHEKYINTKDFEDNAKDDAIEYLFKLIPKIRNGKGAVVTELGEIKVLKDIKAQTKPTVIVNQNYIRVGNSDQDGKIEYKGGGETVTGYTVDGTYPQDVTPPDYEALPNGRNKIN